MNDAYEILGLTQGANQQDIKNAYRRLVKLCHPDLNPDNPDAAVQLRKVVTAYEFLIQIQSAPSSTNYNFSVDDLIDKIFKSSSHSFSKKNKDLSYILKISFLESCYGTTKKIILTGTESQKSIEVSIPSGVNHNQKLQFQNPNTPNIQEIILNIQVADHPLFVRNDLDIIFCYPLTIPEYLRGGTFTVPTIWGKRSMVIMPQASLAEPIILEKAGIKTADGRQGNQSIHLEIIYPPASDKLEQVLKIWEQLLPDQPRAKLDQFLGQSD